MHTCTAACENDVILVLYQTHMYSTGWITYVLHYMQHYMQHICITVYDAYLHCRVRRCCDTGAISDTYVFHWMNHICNTLHATRLYHTIRIPALPRAQMLTLMLAVPSADK